MHFRWPRFWVDNFRGFNYHLSWQERRRLIIGRVEEAGFGWWIVIVAGVGFLTDAYDIFAINTVIPMISTVYWEGNIPQHVQFGLNCATLLGSMFGQVVFGILADKYGRRKMYGLELVVTIIASLGFAISGPGVHGSMSIFGLFIFWRLVMGVGIGADYPLSAVVVSEFAPTRYRGRMIAAVFFWQPIGQLLATLLALAATRGFQTNILKDIAPDSCSILSTGSGIDCARTVDRVWRLVAGLGVVPAAIAILFRLTIPESVYWVLDVKNDSNQAMQTRDYWPVRSPNTESDDDDSIQLQEISPEVGEPAKNEENLPRHRMDEDGVLPQPAESLPTDSIGAVNQTRTMVTRADEFEDPHPREQSFKDFVRFFWTEGNWTDLLATSLNWMLLDFTFYLLGVNSSRIIPNMFDITPRKSSPIQGNASVPVDMNIPGNVAYLWNIMIPWDITTPWNRTFLGSITAPGNKVIPGNMTILGNSTISGNTAILWDTTSDLPVVIPGNTTFLWNTIIPWTPPPQAPYDLLFGNEWHTLVATSIGAVLGGIIAIKIMNNFSRRIIQMWLFLILSLLFVVVGALYVTLLNTSAAAGIVAVYVLCQFFYNAGPNTTTFIIPAEAFPTRYRCACHGISAASGKLGSVFGQIAVTKLIDDSQNPLKVGYLMISFFVVMVAGAAITKYLTPETCDIDGKSRTLEQLSFGKGARRDMERAERVEREKRERGKGQ